MENGIYIYGVIKTDHPQDFGSIGIGQNTPGVLTLGFQDLAAVISHSPFITYSSLNKESTVKDLVTHQFVIEKVMGHFTIVPVKFGTMVETEEEVGVFLEKGYTLLEDELRKMEGKIELDVVATWQLTKILPTLFRRDRQLQDRQREIATRGSNVGIEEKVELGKLIGQALESEKARHYELILQMLKEHALDVCMHDVVNDEMLFNAAFLLERQHLADFHQEVHHLDQTLEDTINFRVVGPLPLYSFCTIVLERNDPRKLEEARQMLGLDDDITEKVVHNAYRRLAQKYHPDTGSTRDARQFHLAHAAYKTLMHFVDGGSMHIEVYRWEKSMP